MVLKSKLFSMEFLMHEEVIHNTHSDGNNSPQGSLHAVNPSDNTHSDGNNSPQVSLHAVNPSDKSHDCEKLINVKLPTLNTSIYQSLINPFCGITMVGIVWQTIAFLTDQTVIQVYLEKLCNTRMVSRRFIVYLNCSPRIWFRAPSEERGYIV
jgi:hypothetical protein